MSHPEKGRISKSEDDHIRVAGGEDVAGEDEGGDEDDDRPILVAYFVYSQLGDNVHAEMWSDGVWRVVLIEGGDKNDHSGKTGKRMPVLSEVAAYLNTVFPPSRYSSARWDCVLKAADEAAKEADEELVIGGEYVPEPAEPGNGIVY